MRQALKTNVEAVKLAEKVIAFLDNNATLLDGDEEAIALYRAAAWHLPPSEE
jgi:formylmethanofuran dehydrogenase subunit B